MTSDRLHRRGVPATRKRRGARLLALILVLISGCLGATALRAQDVEQARQPVAAVDGGSGRVVDVGIYVSPPFVIETDGQLSGMAIDLWKSIAESQNLQSKYRPFATFGELVDATASNEVDIAVTNLTITRKREERIDFTQPWFDSGHRIMVNTDQGVGIGAVFAGLTDAGHLRAYAWLAFVIVIATALMTLFDRRFDPDFPPRWPDGIAESFYTVMSVATSGRPPSRKNLFGWIGRMWSALWLVSGIAVLSYVTASITSVMTTLSLNNQISNVNDLSDQTVAVLSGSTAEDFAIDTGLDWRPYPNIDAAATALTTREISAIIGDAPVLEYFAHTTPDLPVDVVGPIFEPDKYGFGLAPANPLTKAVTLGILDGKESGLIEGLRARYFGEGP